ncbi:hypothetical protein J5226_23540 [Lysobacter sp. K5869]|uniref:hypothetical protein n=1 Tax=Lysobacter sp. K5869 TaxID=2820808 RepID=UPI001C05FF0A|nr:hypothetical protein [Lysobacter sp. K5869]QWP76518.1 hypothetical protein J5226_23540 [Lysobacter sp. K5869]
MTAMIRTLAPLTLALIAAAAPSAAFAQSQTTPHTADRTAPMQRTEPPVHDTQGDSRTPPPSDAIGPARFSELDANGDQKISRDEAAMDARLAGSFAVHDLDRDGFISLSEYQAGQNKRSDDR